MRLIQRYRRYLKVRHHEISSKNLEASVEYMGREHREFVNAVDAYLDTPCQSTLRAVRLEAADVALSLVSALQWFPGQPEIEDCIVFKTEYDRDRG